MRSPLWLLAICALAWIPACEQFHEPGPKFPPGPGPDPDPDPDLRPMREIVVEPGATVEAGTTLSFATTGDPLLATDLITWTLTANGDTVNRFPEGSGPVSFPDLARFGTPLAQDASFSVPPMVRPVTPGNYTLRVRETGTGYDPIQRDVPVLVQPAVAMQFRPEATEVTGLPPEGEANALAGILLPAHAVALSEGDGGDGLGELLVVMARQQRVDTASGEIANEFAVYLGHVESGFWSIPIVVSTDPLDRLMETAPPPVLREYGARNLQSFGVHADGREVELAWTDRENTLVYKAATIAANTGAIGFTLGNRVEIADGPLRVVPLRAPDGRALLATTNGTPIQSQRLVTYLVDRSTGAVESRMADIILSTSTTARLRAHDAALATDGTLRIAGLEQSGGNNSVPNITYAVVGSSFTTVPTLRTVQPAVITQEPPAILVSGSDPVWIAYAGEDGAAVERIDGPTLAVPAIGGEVFVRNIDLALNPQVPDQLLVLVQQASGSTLENLRGTLQFFTAPWDLAALMPFDGGAVPSSVLPSVDNGPGNVVAGIGAIHVIWQENGIGQNRNTRILEARTN